MKGDGVAMQNDDKVRVIRLTEHQMNFMRHAWPHSLGLQVDVVMRLRKTRASGVDSLTARVQPGNSYS